MPPHPRLPSSTPLLRPSNRIGIILTHIPWYWSAGQKRLADDVGVSRSTISRLASDQLYPSLPLAQRVTAALSARLKRPLSVDDVFSTNGKWREPSGCRLCGCPGCFPDNAYDRRGSLKPAFQNQQPGDWSLGTALDSVTIVNS